MFGWIKKGNGMNNILVNKGESIFNMELYNRYNESKSANLDNKIAVLTDIIRQYPKVIDYIFNRMDTCFGPHIVYLVHMKVGGTDMIKMGYTKNTVQGRFAETRYSGRNTIEIIEVLREKTLQAKAAVDFETRLKEICFPYRIVTDLTLPGKGEFMDIEYKEQIVLEYDNLYPNFQEIVGLKAPN